MSNQFRLLLFIVVISGALCTVEDYVIMSQCAHNKAIHVAAEGTVSVTDISQTQNITIVGLPDYVNNNLKIALYAKETQRYLCFNDQWKLVGMKELRDTCYFNETIVHGYFVFRSVVDLQRRVGFTHRGKAVGPKKNVNDACYLFTKIQADQFFHQHTDYFAPKSKSTKIISGIGNSPHTTTATHTTSRASARLSSQRAALSAAATTATVTATATAAQRNYSNNNRLLRNNNKNKRMNGMRSGNRHSNNNQNEEYTNGHSSNLSSSNNSNNNNNQSINNHHNNSSNLVSNSQQQQVDVSQQKQNNNSNGRTREQVRQQQQQHQHQVRHHHNDPNLIARRQQHEHKQKRRQHQRQQQQRLRSGKITSPTTTTAAQNAARERSSAATTTKAVYSTTATAAAAVGNKQQEKGTRHEPQAATVANVAAKAATATSILMKSTTTIANKRKGRRRKGRKQRKQQQQRAQQQLLPLAAREHAMDAVTPTQTIWLWSDSPTPPLSSLSTPTLPDVSSGLPTVTTYADYSGEWQSSVATYADATTVDTAASSSLTPTLSSLAMDTPTQTYAATTTDLSDSASSLMSTSDYNNNTDFTSSETLADEEPLNATFVTEIDDSQMSPEPTMPAAEQINSITSQQQHFTTQNVATSVSTTEAIAPTSTTWSETPTTTTNGTDDDELMFPESVAATAIFSGDNNATEETQTVAEDADLYATINTTSSEIETESSSSSSSSNTNNDDNITEPLAEIGGTQSTTTALQNVFNLPAERENIGHMWKQQSGIAASIATLLHKQLLATSASSGNEYAWRPQRGEEYSDEIIVATGRPVITEHDTTTDIASGERAIWWQQHMNHSGTNFWDKGIADEVPSSDDNADLDWLKHANKHRNASKRRHNHRKASSNNSRDVEVVSQQPQQALSSDSSLSLNKKYLAEGKLQRQSSKALSGNNKLLTATTTAHEYSSTMATTRTSSATTHTEGVVDPTATTTIMSDKTLATTTTTQHLYPLQQLLGNKTILPLHSQSPLVHFDGNSNHLAHTHSPTATTLSTSTSAAVPTSTTMAGDATTSVAALTTKKSIRISTQKLLATPFHQLTYVRNNAGDIDIDNIDNISVYPDLLEESGELADQHSTERAEADATRNSRLTIVSGYLPTSATATLPESIRLAKVKINKERKRMMSLRKRHTRRQA